VEKVLGREVMFVPEIAGDVVKQAVGILGAGDIACWKTPASGRARKRTTPSWSRRLPPTAIS
jgi:phosphoglycerate kinase